MKTEWLLWWGDGEHLRRQAKTKEALEKYMEKEFIKHNKFFDKSGKELPYDVKFNVDADKHCIEVDDFFIKNAKELYWPDEKATNYLKSKRSLVKLLECNGLYYEEVEYVYDDGDAAGGPFKTKITITKKKKEKR